MIKLLFESEVHGQRIVLIDNDDLKTISDKQWCLTGDGNYVVSSELEYMHRIISGAKLSEMVDHINLSTHDNRKQNLRITTKSGNSMNRNKIGTPCSSKYKGVVFDKSRNLWIVKVSNKHIGRFETESIAALVYNHVAKKVHGEFFRKNTIPDCELEGVNLNAILETLG